MGQKINSLGFRLGKIKKHKSIWYSKFNNYQTILKEDIFIRQYLENLKLNFLNVLIFREEINNKISIIVEVSNLKTIDLDIKIIISNIKKKLKISKKILIKFSEIENIFKNSKAITYLIINQLQKRISYKKIINNIFSKIKKEKINGIKISIAGRINGAELARYEWFKKGRIPLQTLRADIDFNFSKLHTSYGILGIKVWIFKKELY
uniref:Small ribosomal subunit protein uS3c n=1 Tax=Nitzschia sp. IriIs04 TaxID=1444690 RepID=A0A0S3QPW7_9STRA|nr:ribosomal protein S3 [Nitzschia sp. IriIs04]BAT70305.1 ribosomal protein S3 [Nitzschia sp. IriIs04]